MQNEFEKFISSPQPYDKFWEQVDVYMKHFSNHSNPQIRRELYDIAQAATEERNSQLNDFASNQTKTLRRLGLFPDRLIQVLKKIYAQDGLPLKGETRQKKWLTFAREFFKRYPAFAIARKI